jgi:hypothetical protein
LVQSYAGDANVSVDEARRLAIQDRIHGLDKQLRDALGPDFGGMWLDRATGDVVVASTKSDQNRDGKALEAMRDELDCVRLLILYTPKPPSRSPSMPTTWLAAKGRGRAAADPRAKSTSSRSAATPRHPAHPGRDRLLTTRLTSAPSARIVIRTLFKRVFGL